MTVKLLSAICLSIIVIIAAVISEIFSRDDVLPAEIARKFVHIVAGITTAYSVKIINDKTVLIVFGSGAILITFLLLYYNTFRSIRQTRKKSWGSFGHSVSYLLLVLFFFPAHDEIIFTAMLVFGISDSFAAIFGSIFSKSFYKLTSDEKSIIGSFTFFFFTSVIIFLFFSFQNSIRSPESILVFTLFVFAISLILTITEAISSKGIDNFLIPIFTIIILYIFKTNSDPGLISQFILGVILSSIVALISVRFSFLTPNGSAATFILAAFIFGFGGFKWALPIMTFFLLSSLLSKIRKKSNHDIETYFEKTGTRDYLQVLANGGIGGILVVYNQIFPAEVNYYIYLASLAAVCADTWATEIGTLRKRTTYNILTFRKTDQGISGGISFVGTLGAILGSFVIAMSGLFWVDMYLVSYLLLIVVSGLLGSFFDSLLGATVQAQGKCGVCEKITEKHIHCGQNTSHYRGFRWLNNDAVNFLASIFSVVFIIIIIYIN